MGFKTLKLIGIKRFNRYKLEVNEGIIVAFLSTKKLVNNAQPAHDYPGNATIDLSNYNYYLIDKPQYVLFYSKDNSIPNWISWHVTKGLARICSLSGLLHN